MDDDAMPGLAVPIGPVAPGFELPELPDPYEGDDSVWPATRGGRRYVVIPSAAIPLAGLEGLVDG